MQQVINAVSPLIILLSSISSSANYFLAGAIRIYPDMLICGLVSLVGGYVGSKIGYLIMYKYKKVILNFY